MAPLVELPDGPVGDSEPEALPHAIDEASTPIAIATMGQRDFDFVISTPITPLMCGAVGQWQAPFPDGRHRNAPTDRDLAVFAKSRAADRRRITCRSYF